MGSRPGRLAGAPGSVAKYLHRQRITRHDFHRRDIDLLSPAGLYATLLDFRDRLPEGSDAARLLADAGVVREGGRGCDA